MKKLFQKILCVIAIIIPFSVTIAQKPLEIIGKITDPDGMETPGAVIQVKGTTKKAVANIDGKYKISVTDPQNDVLVFSYIGMKTQEIKISGKTIINVVFESSSKTLDEVVAIGYGTMKRRDMTGAISSVKGTDIAKVPVTSVSQALAGKVAGVTVTQSQGSPDAEISIRVRGGLSITQSNEPLYIIDGFPSEDGLAGLDPSDIESMEVLKDASATAIYGSRGGNGVILIKTKEGFEGKATVNYDMYYGIKKLTNKMKLLTTEQFVGLEYERAMIGGASEKTGFVNTYGDGYDATLEDPLNTNMYNTFGTIHDVYANRPGVDWQGLVFDDVLPISQNHKISISGGNKTTKYNCSYSYSNDEGIMKESGLIRNNLRARFDQQLNDKTKFSASISHSDEKTNGMGSLNETSYFSRMQHIIQYRPIISKNGNDQDLILYQNDPILEEESGNQMQNPIVSIENEKQSKHNKTTVFSGELSYNLTKRLAYRGSVSLRNRAYTQDLFYQKGSRQAINAGAPYGQRNIQEYGTLTYNNVLTYKPKTAKSHNLDFMLGQEYSELNYTQLLAKSTNFPDDNFGLDDMSLGETPEKPITDRYTEHILSFFGRANYNYKQKYLATFTLRADGSSKFGKNNLWGYFPSGSLAWRLSEEDFVRNLNVFSNLKLRLSYGEAGNNRIGNYRSLSKMISSWQPFEKGTNVSYYSSQLPNPNVQWETKVSANAGLDMGFFDQRLQVVIDAYNNQTKNLLLETRLPLLSGYPTTMLNIGKTQNTGVELTINTVNVSSAKFSWNTGFNISFNKNKVVQLAGVDYFTTRSGWCGASEFNDDDYIIRVGESLGSMYGYKLIGLYTVDDFNYDPATKKYTVKDGVAYDPDNYPKPGYNKFENTNNKDLIINSEDKQVIGNSLPDFSGGLSNTLAYNGFDLSFSFNFSIGNDVYNANKMYFTKTNNRYRNSLALVANRFTYIDETGANVFTNPDKLAQVNANAACSSIEGSSVLRFHSGYIEDGSYLRLNDLTFGYTLPKKTLKKIHVSNLRFYTSGYNLLLLTKYSGFDPEVNAKANGGLTPGVDWGAYPRSLSFVVGMNLAL